jgi:hypothetical protein
VIFVDAFEEARLIQLRSSNNKLSDDEEVNIDSSLENYENCKNIEEISIAGKILGKIVLNQLREMGLNLNKCVGIRTDSCSVMTLEICGAVAEILKFHRMPVDVHVTTILLIFLFQNQVKFKVYEI